MHLYWFCCVLLLDWHREFGSTGKDNPGRISDIETLRKMMHLPQIPHTAITSDPLIGLKLGRKLESDLFITLFFFFKARGRENNAASSSPSPTVDFIGGFDSYGYQPPQKSSHLQLQPLYTWVTNVNYPLQTFSHQRVPSIQNLFTYAHRQKHKYVCVIL